jgi:hypothetical protein
MALDLRTDEQRAIDAVVEAKIALDSPEADGWREIIKNSEEELSGFIAASKRREADLSHKQAMERDDFAKSELRAHVSIQTTLDTYRAQLAKLAGEYASKVEALRSHYASVYPADDVGASIRKVLRGDLHGEGVNVETKFSDNGDVITRIRRGLHAMGASGVPGCDVVAVADSPQDDAGEAPEGLEPAPGGLDAGNITEALERGARAIGEDLKPLGLDFSLDAEQKG